MLGKVTRQNVCHPFAPSEIAACSSSLPCACMSGINSRAMKGNVTNTVTSTMPGTAKRILMWCALSQGHSQPCRPNNNAKIIPLMIGDTAKGKSMIVSSTLLPRKSNFATAHAAATPKTRFSATALPAAINVTRTAARVSGFRNASK